MDLWRKGLHGFEGVRLDATHFTSLRSGPSIPALQKAMLQKCISFVPHGGRCRDFRSVQSLAGLRQV